MISLGAFCGGSSWVKLINKWKLTQKRLPLYSHLNRNTSAQYPITVPEPKVFLTDLEHTRRLFSPTNTTGLKKVQRVLRVYTLGLNHYQG